MKTTTTKILLRPAKAPVERHLPCTTCGGAIEQGPLAEGVDPETGCLVCCCGRCLRAGDVELRMTRWQRHLEDEAALVRSLKGRLVLPAVAEHDEAEGAALHAS